MNCLAIILSLIFLFSITVSHPLNDDKDKIHIPEKCEDVLAVKVCLKLEETAKNLKLTSQEVREAIKDAVRNGKTKSGEIIEAANNFLQQKVLSKKCEDFTTPDASGEVSSENLRALLRQHFVPENCNNLRDLASKLKIKASEVEKFVVRSIADGAVKAKDLYEKVVEYYKIEISTKTCEDFLTQKQCGKIREIAQALKIKTDNLEKAIVGAVLKAYVEGKDTVTEIYEQMKELAKNTTCEDLLNPNVCESLRKYANLTKVGFPKVMEAVRDSIVKGYTIGKGLVNAVYKIVDYFYDCEDVFTTSSCDRLKYWLGKLGVKAVEIDQIVRDYAKKGIATAKELYEKIYDFLKDKVVCKISPWCKDSTNVISTNDFDYASFLHFMKDYKNSRHYVM